jgi:hypothetical protein
VRIFSLYFVFYNVRRVTVTDTLKKDASEMEARLQALQERMRQQQRESEAQAKAGSSAKWKSARAEKGSVTRYQKEVQDKHKKRHETEGGGDPALRTEPRASGTHRTARQAAVAAAADSDFRSRGAAPLDPSLPPAPSDPLAPPPTLTLTHPLLL